MPYIRQGGRGKYESYDECPTPLTPGDFNYVVTRLALKSLGSSPHYEDYNAIIGAMECCKLELYRRAVAVFEDKKILENGDVF